jgi:glycine/D-amino acid oxidase-like deaminating enzyme
MMKIDELGQVISTDVLVLGGGIAGLCAAIEAKEKPIDVLVVDKGGIGWQDRRLSGQHDPASILNMRMIGAVGSSPMAVSPRSRLTSVAREVHKTVMRLNDLGLPFSKVEKWPSYLLKKCMT